MWQAFEVLINFYQAALITYFINKCCNLRAHALWKDFLLAFIIGVTICLMDVIAIYPLDDLVFLIPLSYAIYYRQGKVMTSVFWCVILVMIISIDSTLSSSLITMLTNASWEDMLVMSDVRIIYVISANLLHTLIVTVLTIFAGKRHILYPGAAACFLLSLGIQLAVAECFFVIRIRYTVDVPLTAYGSLGMLFSMLLTIALHEIMIRQAEKQQALEVESQTSRLINAHQEELRTIYSNMLSTQHDLRHRIAAAEQLLANQRPNASNEIMELLQDTDILHEYITGNISVDAILTSKAAVMQEQGIRFSFYPIPLKQLPLSEQQFSIILSNILDNAIEGVMRLPSPVKDPEIKLLFSRNWDVFSIVCENDMNPETIHVKDGHFVSSKSEPFMHGYGTKSIKNIVENAGGMIDFSTKDKRFIVNIMLPVEE